MKKYVILVWLATGCAASHGAEVQVPDGCDPLPAEMETCLGCHAPESFADPEWGNLAYFVAFNQPGDTDLVPDHHGVGREWLDACYCDRSGGWCAVPDHQ